MAWRISNSRSLVFPVPVDPRISTTDPRDNLKLEALIREKGDLRRALLEAAGA
jgi:hypothetical protein